MNIHTCAEKCMQDVDFFVNVKEKKVMNGMQLLDLTNKKRLFDNLLSLHDKSEYNLHNSEAILMKMVLL